MARPAKPAGARVSGPLAPFAGGFVAWLLEQGYRPGAVGGRLRLMAELSAWLAARGLGPAQLAPPLVEEFLSAAGVSGRGQRWCSLASGRDLVGYLRDLGAVPSPVASIAGGPVERLVEEFAAYLVRERGIASAITISNYERTARLFLPGRVSADGRVVGLTAGEVSAFVLGECQRHGRVRSGQTLVSTLRGLLRFLYLEGLAAEDLTGAVPSVAKWRGGSLPKALDVEWVGRLLASCDRASAAGRRDFAILTVLTRLGLRSGEVAALKLGDVDWRAGEISVRGKGDRLERLPLPCDVGDAVADYLRRGRPDRRDRHVFLRVRAPFLPLTGGTIGMVVRNACGRAELPRVGAHRLRHTVASETLRAGAPLEEIASLLRHRRHATTVIYAKVDWERLREVARPWPGSLS